MRTEERQSAQAVFSPLLDILRAPQTDLRTVIRFEKYSSADPDLRKQDTLQHSYSLILFAIVFLSKMRKHLPDLDEAFFLKAVAVHDMAEGLLKRDIVFVDKKDEHDLHEYMAFMAEWRKVEDEVLALEMRRAFLLQFAHKNPDIFPPGAAEDIRLLRYIHDKENLAFQAMEALDYLFYAFEGWIHYCNDVILVQILRNQVPRLDVFTKTLPGFEQEWWTTERSAWCKQFMADHTHVPAEEKKKA